MLKLGGLPVEGAVEGVDAKKVIVGNHEFEVVRIHPGGFQYGPHQFGDIAAIVLLPSESFLGERHQNLALAVEQAGGGAVGVLVQPEDEV